MSGARLCNECLVRGRTTCRITRKKLKPYQVLLACQRQRLEDDDGPTHHDVATGNATGANWNYY